MAVKANDSRTSVEVVILGQRMVLKADEDRKRVERIAAYINEKTNELQQGSFATLPPAKLAALVALNLADDYFRALYENIQLKRAVAGRARALLNELES